LLRPLIRLRPPRRLLSRYERWEVGDRGEDSDVMIFHKDQTQLLQIHSEHRLSPGGH
jgi:hypothetical protein